MATHDTEPETECSCSNCIGPNDENISEPQEKDPLDISNTSNKRATKNSQKKQNLLKQMQSQFNEDDDTDDDEVLKPYECGKCSLSFSTIDILEKHVSKEHTKSSNKEIKNKQITTSTKEMTPESIDEVIDEFAKDVEAMETSPKIPSSPTKPKIKKPIRPIPERNWQECPDRNWAAEFGYGGKTSIGPTRDILSRFVILIKDSNLEKSSNCKRNFIK